tara:strand:- start:5291 stop:5815 length:525 start_codon:yes stop_codon:yes gene_type:complete
MRTPFERFEALLQNMADQVGEEAVLAGVKHVRDNADPEFLKRAKKALKTDGLFENTILESIGMPVLVKENIAKKALNVLFPTEMDVEITDPLPLPVESSELSDLLKSTNRMLQALTSTLVDNFDQLDLSVDDLIAVTAGTSRADVEAAQAAGHDVTDTKGRTASSRSEEQPIRK